MDGQQHQGLQHILQDRTAHGFSLVLLLTQSWGSIWCWDWLQRSCPHAPGHHIPTAMSHFLLFLGCTQASHSAMRGAWDFQCHPLCPEITVTLTDPHAWRTVSSPGCSQHSVGSSNLSLVQHVPLGMDTAPLCRKEKPLPKTPAAAVFLCTHEHPSQGAQGEETSAVMHLGGS